MRKPTDKQVKLIEGYLETGNAYGSAKKAGYSESWAKVQAKHWLEKGKGKEYITEMLDDSEKQPVQ